MVIVSLGNGEVHKWRFESLSLARKGASQTAPSIPPSFQPLGHIYYVRITASHRLISDLSVWDAKVALRYAPRAYALRNGMKADEKVVEMDVDIYCCQCLCASRRYQH
jgi:hypothetical protein